jgi:sugar transferase (PEP-CTERM/EpsH1 system associated)
MRILYLCQRIPYPPNKGEKLRSFHQIAHLLAQGHQVDVFAPLADNTEASYVHGLEQQGVSKVFSPVLGSAHLAFAKALLTGRALSEAKFYRSAVQAQFNQCLNEGSYDVLVVCASSLLRYLKVYPYFDELAKQTRVMLDFMDLDSDKWGQYANASGLLMRMIYRREQRLVAKLEQQAAQLIDAGFFISDKEVALFQAQHPNLDLAHIHTLGNGIDTQYFSPGTRVSHQLNTFLFVGVMDYKPNVDAVLWFVEYVWPTLLKRNHNAQLIVAGMQPTAEILALDSQPSIQVTGFVDDIVPTFQAADVFVAPFQIARGVQNKILQAMACGLPVITSPLGAEGIIAEHGSELLLAEDAAGYVSHVTQLQSQDNYERVASRCRQRILHEYSWDGQLALLGKAIGGELADLGNATRTEVA